MTGMPAKISNKIGGKWSAFGGSIHGRNIMFIPGRMIVQSWRSSAFNKSDTDSILVITFTEVRGGSRVDLVHVNVAAQDHKGVTNGWRKYYWGPWRAYLAKKR
jgi:hypothetical protein